MPSETAPSPLPYIAPRHLDGSETFRADEKKVDRTLLDFWRWAASDLVGNTFRGWLAEYIVAMDLGVDHQPRLDWGPYDLATAEGVKIEVKCSAYLQSWTQKRPSTPLFSIRRARAWDLQTNALLPEAKRHSDAYVFALHHHRDKGSVDPMDLCQWTFFVLRTALIDQQLGSQKRISLKSIESLGGSPLRFGEIRLGIRSLFDGSAESAEQR